MEKVFVSYSRRNKSFAERLARDLSDAGMEVWVDFRQIHGGEMWQEEIYRGIELSGIVIVCLSPPAVASEWVQREIESARQQKKTIIPVMVENALGDLQTVESLRWLLDVHFIQFEGRYEAAFPELLQALPGRRRVGAYDVVDVAAIPNPFKGLEAFQQTDAHFFFGRERLIEKSLQRLRQDRPTRFLAVVGASGSGKSSLVRAGIMPTLRRGALPASEHWRMSIFMPGGSPVEALAQRLAPLIESAQSADITRMLGEGVERIDDVIDMALAGAHEDARLLLVVDQFEEVFTRAGPAEREKFLNLLEHAATEPGGRAMIVITMRADFFDRLSGFPALAELFEQENMIIVAEMTAVELLRAIEGPAQAVGLVYDDGLPQRILDDVRREPGSLPLLQYALKELYQRRDGIYLTTEAYDAIGGVRQALARHAEDIYLRMGSAQQAIMRRVLLRLVEVSETGEATRRKVERADLVFRDVPDQAVQELLDLLTAAETRLLIASRQIGSSSDEDAVPTVMIEIGHEALVREWERFRGWVAEDVEQLRQGTELLQAAQDWRQGGGDVAYLLVGNRLLRAQAWLQEADATPLQREFIQASIEENARREQRRQLQVERELALQRKAANRLRSTVGVLIVGLVAAIALILLAVNSEQRAQEALAGEQAALGTAVANEQRAVANERRALSLVLASGANQARADQDNEMALLLAVNANEVENPPPQAQRTLADIVFAPGTRQLFDQAGTNVYAAALLPAEGQALTTSSNEIVVWDVASGEELNRFGTGSSGGHSATIWSLAVSPDQQVIASGDADGRVLLWTADGELLRELSGPTDLVSALTFSADGAYLLAASADGQTIRWELATGRILTVYSGGQGAVISVDIRPDGERVLTGHSGGVARLWTLDGELLQTLQGHEGAVNAVAFSPVSAAQGLTASDDGTVRMWNLNTGGQVRVFDGHEGAVLAVAYAPDGRSFASGGDDASVRLWNPFTTQQTAIYAEHTQAVQRVQYADSNTLILTASADGTARLWDLQRGDEVRRYEGHSLDVNARTITAVYSADGRSVLSGSFDSTLRLWERDTGQTVQEFQGHSGPVYDVDLSADQTTAISVSQDGSLIVWDVASGQPRLTLRDELRPGPLVSVALLPNGRRALSGALDGSIVLWDIETGDIVRRYGPQLQKDAPGHTGAAWDVSVSPDGERFASAGNDGVALLWSIDSGRVIQEFKGHADAVLTAHFDRSGQRLATGANDGAIIVWDTTGDSRYQPTGVVRRILGHDRTVQDVDFSPDGALLASGSRDRTLRLWDLASGFEVRRYIIPGSAASFRSVRFDPDGLTILTGMTDATIREWRALLRPQDLIAWAYHNRFVPQPTCEDREQFNLTPLCEGGVPPPTRTPFPQPTPTPTVP